MIEISSREETGAHRLSAAARYQMKLERYPERPVEPSYTRRLRALLRLLRRRWTSRRQQA